jgi:hypothetical protein
VRNLDKIGFQNPRVLQTLFGDPDTLHGVEPAVPGHGVGGFVVIRAEWRNGD